MDNSKIQLIGAPCGYHGPYTFFKAFKYYRNGKHKILSLSDFFFVKLWSDLDLMSIGEVQLLWMDKNSEQVLASLRLYFLPENTPDGRNDDHGEDEVLAISEKVVLRVEDLLDRIIEDADWSHGMSAVWDNSAPADSTLDAKPNMLLESACDFDDIVKEKQLIGDTKDADSSAVVVLSFPRYCRYRGIMKRIEGVTNKWTRHELVVALGGFAASCKHTRVVFCKDTFDYPDLEGLELLCNHLAPNLKGRPRRKRKKRSLSPGGSESNESESSLSTVSSVAIKIKQPANRNGIRCNNLRQPRRSNRVTASVEEKDFLVKLHAFMKSKHTPIGRLPDVGFKELDLFLLYKRVQKLGGYGQVTAARMWKLIYDQMEGDSTRNGAATYMRRQYEKFLLPYEMNIRGSAAGIVPCRDNAGLDTTKGSSLGDPDVKNIVTIGGKMSALRCVRARGDKSSLDSATAGTLPPDKENIPLSNRSSFIIDLKQEPGASGAETTTRDKPVPELIDITDLSDSPAKPPKTTVLPALKKRKLEILKEGGLEVTAISAAMIPETSGVTITSERRPSVIQHASPVQRCDSQISITVTPDVSHMLGSPIDLLPTSSSGRRRNTSQSYSSGWDPQRVTQSRSIYTHSEATIYGNPKDGLLPAAPSHHHRHRSSPVVKPAPSATEVLDLRVNSGPKPARALPLIDGRTLLGSNLEITVVDVQKQYQQQQQQQQRRHSNQHRKSLSSQPRRNNVVDLRPNSYHPHPPTNGRSSSNHAARSSSRGNSSTSVGPHPSSGKSSSSTTSPGSMPYGMYYPAMYNTSQLYSYLPQMQAAQAAAQQPPIFAPTAEHLQLYKDLMSHHHTMMQAQQSSAAAGFLGLPRDGSTSITPVSRVTTPTSK